MPVDFMEQDEAAPEKPAAVGEVEMAETEPTMQAAAAAEPVVGAAAAPAAVLLAGQDAIAAI